MKKLGITILFVLSLSVTYILFFSLLSDLNIYPQITGSDQLNFDTMSFRDFKNIEQIVIDPCSEFLDCNNRNLIYELDNVKQNEENGFSVNNGERGFITLRMPNKYTKFKILVKSTSMLFQHNKVKLEYSFDNINYKILDPDLDKVESYNLVVDDSDFVYFKFTMDNDMGRLSELINNILDESIASAIFNLFIKISPLKQGVSSYYNTIYGTRQTPLSFMFKATNYEGEITSTEMPKTFISAFSVLIVPVLVSMLAGIVPALLCLSLILSIGLFNLGIIINYSFLLLLIPLLLSFFKNKKLFYLCLLIMIVIYGLYLRLNAFSMNSGSPIASDLASYQIISKSQGWGEFYNANVREPLWPYTLKFFSLFLGTSDTAASLTTIVLSSVLIIVTFEVSKRIFNNPIAILSSFFVSINPYLIQASVRGLRLELFTILLLLLFYFLFYWKNKNKIGIVGIISGLLFLLRLETIAIIPIIYSYYFLTSSKFLKKWKITAKRMIPAILIPCLMVFPFLINSYLEYREPFYVLNIHATGWANVEFAGQPGFPSQEEIREHLYSGEHRTAINYVLGKHDLLTIISNLVEGYRLALLVHTWIQFSPSISFSILLQPLYLAGVIILAVSGHLQFLIMIVASIFPNVFTISLGSGARHVMHIFPMVAICTAYTIYKIYLKTKLIYKRGFNGG